jgi:hypothetical protein
MAAIVPSQELTVGICKADNNFVTNLTNRIKLMIFIENAVRCVG